MVHSFLIVELKEVSPPTTVLGAMEASSVDAASAVVSTPPEKKPRLEKDVSPESSATPLQQAFLEASQAWKVSGASDLKKEITNLRQEREALKKEAQVKTTQTKRKAQKVRRAKAHTAKVPTDDLMQLVAERLCQAQQKAEKDDEDEVAGHILDPKA